MNSRLLLFFPQAPLCYPVGGECNRDFSPTNSVHYGTVCCRDNREKYEAYENRQHE
jgi:hypothetical protein